MRKLTSKKLSELTEDTRCRIASGLRKIRRKLANRARVEALVKSVKQSKDKRDHYGQIRHLESLATAYCDPCPTPQCLKAIECYQAILDVVAENAIAYRKAHVYRSMADIYVAEGMMTEAVDAYKAELQEILPVKVLTQTICLCNIGKAMLDMVLKDHVEYNDADALGYIDRAADCIRKAELNPAAQHARQRDSEGEDDDSNDDMIDVDDDSLLMKTKSQIQV